ncbi:MAG: hypothetical protein DWH82_06155 [Planctomycetota bacterium]|nr:MAG: hypothetical protein DWH82_06155 [Planctomycetota bacterium]
MKKARGWQPSQVFRVSPATIGWPPAVMPNRRGVVFVVSWFPTRHKHPMPPPWRLQRIEQGKGFLSLFPERFGTGRVFTGILPSGAYAPGKTAAPGG